MSQAVLEKSSSLKTTWTLIYVCQYLNNIFSKTLCNCNLYYLLIYANNAHVDIITKKKTTNYTYKIVFNIKIYSVLILYNFLIFRTDLNVVTDAVQSKSLNNLITTMVRLLLFFLILSEKYFINKGCHYSSWYRPNPIYLKKC